MTAPLPPLPPHWIDLDRHPMRTKDFMDYVESYAKLAVREALESERAKQAEPVKQHCRYCGVIDGDGHTGDCALALGLVAAPPADAALPLFQMQEAAKDLTAKLDEAVRLLERCEQHMYNPFEPDNQSRLYNDLHADLARVRR